MTKYTFENYKEGYVADEQGFTNEVAEFLVQYYNIPVNNLPKDSNRNIYIPCYTPESPEIIKLISDSRSQQEVTPSLSELCESMTDKEYVNFLAHAFLKSNFILELGGIFVTYGEGTERPLVYAGELSRGFYCYVNNITSNDKLPTKINAFYTRLGKEALKKGLNLKETVSGKLDADLFDPTVIPDLSMYKLIYYEHVRRGFYDEDDEYEGLIGTLTGVICAKSAKEDQELFTRSPKDIEERYINPAQKVLNTSLDAHLPKEKCKVDDIITKELTLTIISDATNRFENI